MSIQKKQLTRKLPLQRNKVKLFVSLFIMSIAVLILSKSAYAENASITVKEINYEESTITLQVKDNDTVVYFSDSNKKVWDAIPGKVGNDKTITMDISWISISSNYVINFKADYSTNIVSVTLPKQVTSFKAAFNKIKGTVTFSGAGNRTIEWRKSASTAWSNADLDTLPTELAYLFSYGAKVCFRLAPINGYGISNVGYRASKEVSVTIPRKSSAPTIKVDGSSFYITLMKGISYRRLYSNGTTTDWTTVNNTTDYLLSNIASDTMFTSNSAIQKEVVLQFMKNATSTSQVSLVSTISIPMQEGPLDKVVDGIELSYTSAASLSLLVKAASSTKPYEYIMIKAGEVLNYQEAKWTTISSSTAVSINEKSAPNGSHIYVRKKSLEAKDTIGFTLASVEIDVTGSSGISYPNSATSNGLTTLITTAGVCNITNSTNNLSFILYSPTKTTVSSIRFLDSYGNTKGNATLKSTVELNKNSSNIENAYIITTSITSTSELDKITGEILYAHITLANSDTIVSSKLTGVQLYLYPATIINNSNHTSYTTSFQRILSSTEDKDVSSFKFQMDFGVDKVIDPSAIDRYTSQLMSILSITYGGYTLTADTDYKVEYSSYLNTDGKQIKTATVTVYASTFENSTSINLVDNAAWFHINLNNGETLNSSIKMTLLRTATLVGAPISWSITEGSLQETKTTTITNTNESPKTVTEEVITYMLTLTLFDKNYDVAISDVTWGGSSVFGSAIVSNGKATIYISNKKINQLTTTSTTTNNFIITLSNGFVIKDGCKLTIVNAYN